MDKDYFNSIHWTVTIGTNPGFDLENQQIMDYGKFVALFQKISEEEKNKSGVWITAVITPSRLAYRHSAGCPIGGEYAYTLTGSCNTDFASVDDYVPALKRVLAKLKDELGQVTFTLEIIPAHLVFYNDEPGYSE